MTVYKAAIIGTGGIAEAHMRAWQANAARERVIAAMDVDVGRVRDFAGANDIPGVYTDVEHMLAEVQPDLVHICSPPHMHVEQIVQCLDAGAWVFCEKPLCAGLADWDTITAAEERTGRYCEVVYQWRWGSAARHLRQLIADGTLGRPLTGICDMHWFRPAAYFENPWRGHWDTAFGGPTTNTGIHSMDMFLYTMGDWAEVTAMIGTLDHPTQVEDVSLALVRFENGALASFANTWVSAREATRVRWDFQRATVDCVSKSGYTNKDWRITPASDANSAESDAVVAAWQAMDDVQATQIPQLAALLDAMNRGERPQTSGMESRRTLEFISSLYKSAATGTLVRRGSIVPGDPFYTQMWGTLGE